MDRREFLNAGLSAPVVSQAAMAAPNEKIQQARDAALALLKPTRVQLEHGLELHAQSLVVEPYGFAPRAAVDGDILRKALDAGASELELWDLDEEMFMTRCVTDAAERAEFMQAWDASGVTCIFQNAGEERQDPLVLMKRLSRFTYVADMLGEYVRRGVEADDMVAAKKQNRRCMFFATNGVPLPQDWVSVEQELRYIGMFAGLGVRSMHLTYQRRNMIGDGCGELGNAGLSDFGRAVVAEMNRVGVIIDVAHSGWRTSLEAARASSRPVVASHTGCVAVHNHVRCKPDEVIRAICDSGGFIGVFAVADFLGLSRDIVAMLAHVDHVVKHFGAEHVAIATDLVYVSRKSDEENKKIPRRRRPRKGWEKLWPPGAATTGYDQTRGLAWTNWPLFTVAMVQRGYSDTDIQKILGGNVLRVARAVMPRKISLEGLRTVVSAHAGDVDHLKVPARRDVAFR